MIKIPIAMPTAVLLNDELGTSSSSFSKLVAFVSFETTMKEVRLNGLVVEYIPQVEIFLNLEKSDDPQS